MARAKFNTDPTNDGVAKKNHPEVIALAELAKRWRVPLRTLIDDAGRRHFKLYARLHHESIEWGLWHSPQGMPVMLGGRDQVERGAFNDDYGPRPRAQGEQWSMRATARATRGLARVYPQTIRRELCEKTRTSAQFTVKSPLPECLELTEVQGLLNTENRFCGRIKDAVGGDKVLSVSVGSLMVDVGELRSFARTSGTVAAPIDIILGEGEAAARLAAIYDANSPCHSKSLCAAIDASVALYRDGEYKKGSHLQAIERWVEREHPNVSKWARERIATVVNPNQGGGAAKT